MTTKYRSIKGTNAVISEDQYKNIADIWRGRRASDEDWSFNLKFRSKTGGPLTESSAGAADPSSSGQYGGVIAPDYADGLVNPAGRPLSLAQVLRQEETSSNLVRIVQDIQDQDASGPGAEGAAFGMSYEHPEPHDYHLSDTTVFVPVSEDFLADIPSALSYLTKRLTYLVQRAEENTLVNGDGTDPQFTGLVEAANDSDEQRTVLAQGSLGINSAIATLIASTYNNSGCPPEWILMNADNWLNYATQPVVATTNNEYLAGHANTPGPRTLWNLPVVLSNAVPDANVVVGSSAAVGRWVHTSGIKVDMSPGYSTYFGEGMVAVRAKIRSTLAYEYPAGIGVLTGASPTLTTSGLLFQGTQ